MQTRTWLIAYVMMACLGETAMVEATAVVLQNAEADFEQVIEGGAPYLAPETIDGVVDVSFNGWAIHPMEGQDHVIVWETVSDVGGGGWNWHVDFSLFQTFSFSSHELGKFRLSYTTDDRSTFAGSGQVEGSANWQVITGSQIVSAASNLGSVLTVNPDHSILAGGPTGAPNVYEIQTVVAPVQPITGFRLEALTDPSLPFNGPGRGASGNFVLTEVHVDEGIVPEPSALVHLIGFAGATHLGRRR